VTEEEIMSQDRPTAVRDALVGDVMSAPVVTCLPGVPLTGSRS
jgi:hypothetical protein